MPNCPELKNNNNKNNPLTKKAFQNKLPEEGTHWRRSKEKKKLDCGCVFF